MISFLTAEPVYNQTVNRLTYGGAACMSDENGQLLFSSDGNTVYDQLYRDMPNGQFPTLDGNRYANGSQSVITVPFSGHPLQYYRHKVQE